MLAPAAYSETAMPSLRLARSSRRANKIGNTLLFLLIVGFIVMGLAPWQQSVNGTGNVIAYAPLERQQILQSPIKGRIVALGKGVFENAHVKKGQLIAEIADIDPNYLGRLQDQKLASATQVNAAKSLLEANRRNLQAAKTVVTSFQSQVEAYVLVKTQVIAAADAAVESEKNKVDAEMQQLLEQQAVFAQVEADYNRQKALFEEKIVSQLKYQDAERKLKEAKAKVAKSQAYVKSARNKLSEKQSDA